MPTKQIQWLIRRNFPELEGLEARQPDAWSLNVWLKHLRNRAFIALGSFCDEKLEGAILYELRREKLRTHRVIGANQADLHGRMWTKLGEQHRRRRVEYDVPAEDGQVLAFLHEIGYRIERVFRELFHEEPTARMVREKESCSRFRGRAGRAGCASPTGRSCGLSSKTVSAGSFAGRAWGRWCGPGRRPEGVVLTVAQAAERLALSPSKVYRLVAQRRIPHHRFDGAIRFSESDLEEYLDSTKERGRERQPAKPKPSRPRLRHLS